jgi:hypothetical protein
MHRSRQRSMETISLALSMLAAVVVSAVLVRAIPVAIPTPLVQIGLGASIASVSHREGNWIRRSSSCCSCPRCYSWTVGGFPRKACYATER